MQRSYPLASRRQVTSSHEQFRETAIHEAGHAAAIYLGNRSKQLPPVYFQIKLKELHSEPSLVKTGSHWFAEIEGGCLIQSMPPSADEISEHFSLLERRGFLKALEADIFNLLVGPLAEANYVALRDDEIINSQLVTVNSLSHYGGMTDMKKVHDYLEYFSGVKSEQQKNLFRLFDGAFRFINDRAVWRAITALANYILNQNKNVIGYDEIIAVLDANHYSHRKNP